MTSQDLEDTKGHFVFVTPLFVVQIPFTWPMSCLLISLVAGITICKVL